MSHFEDKQIIGEKKESGVKPNGQLQLIIHSLPPSIKDKVRSNFPFMNSNRKNSFKLHNFELKQKFIQNDNWISGKLNLLLDFFQTCLVNFALVKCFRLLLKKAMQFSI